MRNLVRTLTELFTFTFFREQTRSHLLQKYLERGTPELFSLMLLHHLNMRDITFLNRSTVFRFLFPRGFHYYMLFMEFRRSEPNRSVVQAHLDALVRLDRLYFYKWHLDPRMHFVCEELRSYPESEVMICRLKEETRSKASLADWKGSSFYLVAHPEREKEIYFESNSLVGTFDVKKLWSETAIYSDASPGNFRFYDPWVISEGSRERRARNLKLPEVMCWKVNDCHLIGAFQIVKDDQAFLYEPATDPANGFASGMWQYIKLIPRTNNRVFVEYMWERMETLEAGFVISGRCTRNYFHWLIDYLPKILVFKKLNESLFQGRVPLVIDARMPVQQEQAFKSVLEANGLGAIPVIKLDPVAQITRFKELYVVSPHTYIPDNADIESWNSGALNATYVNFVRNSVLQSAFQGGPVLNLNGQTSTLRFHKRIYLSRRKTYARRVVNEPQVQKLFEKFGFKMVYPEDLSFYEQVHLFYNADVIAGPAGAAFANILFCRPGTKVINMVADVNRQYCLNSNLANIVGCEFGLITGHLLRPRDSFFNRQEWMFSDFEMNLEETESALMAFLEVEPLAEKNV